MVNFNPKAVIVTTQRIYIVDKTLGIIQNFSLLHQQNRLIVRSLLVVAGHTILFSTDHHLYYLTQEKGTSSSGAVRDSVPAFSIILSFNSLSNAKSIQRRQIVGALSDRVLLAYNGQSAEGDGKTQITFTVRAIPLLEPLLLGYLSSISQTKIKQELDVNLVQRACRYLDTNLISPALPRKLRQLGLLNSAIFLYQN